jgi:hypothetical protein
VQIELEFSNPAVNLTSSLVDLSLRQAGDLLSTVLNLAVGSLETAKNTRALLNGVVASQLGVRDAVESAVAWKTC